MKKIIGNLIDLALDGQFDVIAHGCNCFKNFGAGLAAQIAVKIPAAYNADIRHTSPSLGDYSQETIKLAEYESLTIVNCYTQYYYGSPYSENNKSKYPFDTAQARYVAIRRCFSELNQQFQGLKIGLPLIGCGLAGLEWSKVEKIIAETLNQMDVTIVVFNENERIKNNITLTA